MPIVTVKGMISLDDLAEMETYAALHTRDDMAHDFDQFFIQCAIIGLREVMKDGEANHPV